MTHVSVDGPDYNRVFAPYTTKLYSPNYDLHARPALWDISRLHPLAARGLHAPAELRATGSTPRGKKSSHPCSRRHRLGAGRHNRLPRDDAHLQTQRGGRFVDTQVLGEAYAVVYLSPLAGGV